MKAVREVYNQLMSEQSWKSSSIYEQHAEKLIRFSDHYCNWKNINAYNQNVEELLLVFINTEMSEVEIQENIDEIQDNLDIYVEYVIYNDDEEDDDFVKIIIERFLK